MTNFMAAALRAAAGNGEENRQAGMCKPANIPPRRFSGKTLLGALLG
jgi:hypothetical protein